MKTQHIQEHAQMGSRWLVENQAMDGNWLGLQDPKVDAFYKASWAFRETGHPAAAHRTLNYVQRHFFTAEGDFTPRNKPSLNTVHYLYANSYLIIGSVLTHRYDLALPAVRFLLTQQAGDHGGFYSYLTAPGEKSLSDTMTAGATGIACLAAGQIDAARRVADYLAHIISMQPAPKDCFFSTVEADGRLHTDIKEDEAFLRIVDAGKPDQCWYAVGLPFAFLVQLAIATNETRYHDLAQWYFDFQMRCVDPWDGYSSGKAGWGCALLYRTTGEKIYRDIALHIAENIVSWQKADGSWRPTEKVNGGDPALKSADMDLAAEFTLWLSLISANILTRDSCKIPGSHVGHKWSRLFQRWRG